MHVFLQSMVHMHVIASYDLSLLVFEEVPCFCSVESIVCLSHCALTALPCNVTEPSHFLSGEHKSPECERHYGTTSLVRRAKPLLNETVTNVKKVCQSYVRTARRAAQSLHRLRRRKGGEKPVSFHATKGKRWWSLVNRWCLEEQRAREHFRTTN